ncbi:uncharacterized protein LOC127749663 [Frankliniella occidentalis]|uniref:Uncharacterized protein LOC127749663 n=1 Tax=Frankliniella occidentalis TaxID=133901 RepID=A0A9C6U6Z6_FRAOC|nr:uncharacterized protein LOC127749663 [Frankliniella occidentalis]
MDTEVDNEIELLEKKFRDIQDNLQKIAREGPSKDTYRRALKSMVQRLSRPTTPEQAIETFLRWKAASLSLARRRSNMGVQPTAIQRRKEGKTRGAKRIRAGRPYKKESIARKASGKEALPRKLSASVNANKTHIKSHQKKMK